MKRFTRLKTVLLSASLIAFVCPRLGIGQSLQRSEYHYPGINERQAAAQSGAQPSGGTYAAAARPAASGSAASRRKSHTLTTRERIVQGHLQQLTAAGKIDPKAAAAAAESAGTANINFPGFVQADALVPVAGTDLLFTFISLTADVNKDGLPDLVTLQEDGTLNVLLNPGKGNLSSLAVTSTNGAAVASRPYVLYARAVDLNGDGYPDVAAMDVYNNAMLLYMNNKDGSYANPVSFPVKFKYGSFYGSYIYGGNSDALIADVNGDGIPDMVALTVTPSSDSNGNTSTLVEQVTYLGLAAGGFGAAQPDQSASYPGFLSMIPGQDQLVDMNHDGHLDLTLLLGTPWLQFSGNSSYVSVLLGTGTGSFSALPATLAKMTAVIPNLPDIIGGFSAQDFDGDGVPDILLGSSAVYFIKGNGDDTLGTPTAVLNGLPFNSMLGFFDVNGDGIADVLDYFDGGITIYPGKGKGSFASTPSQSFVAGASGNQMPAPVDWDGDGNVDLIQVDSQLNKAALFLGKSGVYHGANLLLPAGENPDNLSVLAVGDYNSDGHPDVLFQDFTNDNATGDFGQFPDLRVAINDGKGNFTYKTLVPWQQLITDQAVAIEPLFADLNGDGYADILWTTQVGPVGSSNLAGVLDIAFSKADGTYAAPVTIPLGTSISCTLGVADVGDLNGDGKLDLVVAYAPADANGSPCGSSTTPSGFFTLINDGKGNFKSTFTALGGNDTETRLIDFNGDGKLDLALVDANDNNLQASGVWVVPGVGDGTFNTAKATQPITGMVAFSLIPGDFDGDGEQDLTVGSFYPYTSDLLNSTGVYLFKGNGNFGFGLPQQYAVGTVASGGAFADFNGDGLPDLALNIVVPNSYQPGAAKSSFVYLANVGGGAFGAMQQTLSVTSDDPGEMAVADFNGDGAPDVLNDGGSGIGIYLDGGAISLGLTSSASTSPQDTAVTVTATLTPSVSTAQPGGTISFYDNGTLLETVGVTGTTTELTLSALPVGANAITAVYSGDSQFNGAKAGTAVNIAVTTLPPSFALAAPSQATLTLAPGATGSATIVLSANATFSGSITLACSGTPSEASCTVSPATITLAGGQSATATVIVATTNENNQQSAKNSIPALFQGAGAVSLAGVFLLCWPSRYARRLRGLSLVLLLAAGAVATLSLSGCGSSNKYPGTPAGTTTLTVTATSGSISQTQTISLTVN